MGPDNLPWGHGQAGGFYNSPGKCRADGLYGIGPCHKDVADNGLELCETHYDQIVGAEGAAGAGVASSDTAASSVAILDSNVVGPTGPAFELGVTT